VTPKTLPLAPEEIDGKFFRNVSSVYHADSTPKGLHNEKTIVEA
jgi:hypothetical protein